MDSLRASGLDTDALAPADLAPVDEFHMGGRSATARIVDMMNLGSGAHVVDIGSALGGTARYLAFEHGCRVSGIDFTPEFVQVARMLTDRTRLQDKGDFRVGSALDLPWPDASFDAATMFHVGMNIADKPRLYAETARVLRPGGALAIYDVLKGPVAGASYPLPWAATPETSFLATLEEMRVMLERAGFEIIRAQDYRETAVRHHRDRLAQLTAGGPPPLGLHLLMGSNGSVKSRNILAMLEADHAALSVVIARSPN